MLDLAATNNVVGKTPAIIGINAGHRGVPEKRPSPAQASRRAWPDPLGELAPCRGQSSQGCAISPSLACCTTIPTFGVCCCCMQCMHARTHRAAVCYCAPRAHTRCRCAGLWSQFHARFVTTDSSSPANEQEGNHYATLPALLALHPSQPRLASSAAAWTRRTLHTGDRTTMPAAVSCWCLS